MTVAAEPIHEQGAASTPSVKRRRHLIPRFGLRTLFVAAVLMSLLLGWYGRHVYRVRQERAAAEALRRVGAQLTMPTFDYAGTTLPADLYGCFPWFYVEEHTVVALDSAKGATDADLQHLGRLRGLTSLWLRGDGFTDEALRRAGDGKSVHDLNLLGTSITGESFAEFGNRERLSSLQFDSTSLAAPAGALQRIEAFPNLRFLQTNGEPLTVEGMRATAKLPELRRFVIRNPPRTEMEAFEELTAAPTLEEFNLQAFPPPPIGDREFAALCRIESLRTLALPAPQLTDAGFAKLADLPNLRDLYVIGCRNVTDVGVQSLVEIETLENVSLASFSLTDAALDSLRELPNLERLHLPAGISREAAQRFADERPECEVTYPDPVRGSKRLEPLLEEQAAASNAAPAERPPVD